ncbi:MAG: RluA family pseudouridine synthase [Candidatus Borkfalkiaceae bacterium]|nr:RluA family pseudouridine synthase [Clostridia bacterium]MDY6223703.1 RluA family pseudouridine synthase [Christensenellaceae bacterium]
MQTTVREFTAEENYSRADVFLSEKTGETRSRIKKLADEGRVYISGVAAKASRGVKAGENVRVEIPEAVPCKAVPENIPLDIVYQDADLAVINKPQGMTVHAGAGRTKGTLVNALLSALDCLSGVGGVMRPGIVHRIDKDTSGLLVVAKNDKAHLSLSGQIAQKTCRRKYYALLEGSVKQDKGRIVTDIGRSPADRLKMAALPAGKGKNAVTDYETVARYGAEYTLCRFTLQTGRTHQIRVHAKYMGHPVVGDPVYGYKKQKFALNGQLLHAYSLSFIHPTTGEELTFYAPLPPYFSQILEKLGRQYGVHAEI